MIRQKNPNRILMVLLSFPAIILLMPFIWSLPVALGLKMLFITAILISLLFGLFVPLFAYFRRLKAFSVLCLLTFIGLVIAAHMNSNFSEKRAKPNSLVYLKDIDENSASWFSYDEMPDSWTNQFFEDASENSTGESNFSSKYGSNFQRQAPAPNIALPEPGIILEEISADSASLRSYSLKIAPNRRINRMELYETRDVNFKDFTVNDMQADEIEFGGEAHHMFSKRWSERLLTYYASNRDTLRIQFSISREDNPEFVLYESAYDLFENEDLKVEKRPEGMIPRPFVLNDATILKKTITTKK